MKIQHFNTKCFVLFHKYTCVHFCTVSSSLTSLQLMFFSLCPSSTHRYFHLGVKVYCTRCTLIILLYSICCTIYINYTVENLLLSTQAAQCTLQIRHNPKGRYICVPSTQNTGVKQEGRQKEQCTFSIRIRFRS